MSGVKSAANLHESFPEASAQGDDHVPSKSQERCDCHSFVLIFTPFWKLHGHFKSEWLTALTGVQAFGKFLDHLQIETRDIRRPPTGHEPLIRYHRLIGPGRAGVL